MKLLFLFVLVSTLSCFAEVKLDQMMSEEEKIKTGVALLTTEQKMELEIWIDQNFVSRGNLPPPTQKKEDILYLSENLEGGKQLRLSDGSTYEIAPDDVQLTGFWITPFPIKIVPSRDPNYPFLIINTNTGTAVKAKLLPPGSTSAPSPAPKPSNKP